jgi:hypothetical protein
MRHLMVLKGGKDLEEEGGGEREIQGEIVESH